MPVLRVMSWNIRTFGTHPATTGDLRRIASIILQSQADIVCIQELMIGNGIVGEVGAEIAQSSFDLIISLVDVLEGEDVGGNWWYSVSGVNSGIADHQRDAYAFVWKQNPAKSAAKFTHGDPVDQIGDISEPVILRQEPRDNFPGRRPALWTANVVTGSTTVPVNIISYHAPTPCNRFSKGVGSGYGINALATLPEIGGGKQMSNGRAWTYIKSVTPLPQIDTIVLGDFNYTMDDKWAAFTYNNLLTNYQACVSVPGTVTYTTYGPSATQAFRLISAYDNIFVLKAHDGFKPACSFTGTSGSIDFIREAAKQLGEASGIRDVATEAAWYVIHIDQYRKQHAVRGISDHLPVWADFSIGSSGGGSTSTSGGSSGKKILTTNGSDNNCLLHAIFGTLTGTEFVDAIAQDRRKGLVAQLRSYATDGAFPSALIRNATLSAMINEFSWHNGAATLLRLLLANAANPFVVAEFLPVYALYVAGINSGRMLYVHEAELLSYITNMTITLWRVDRSQYVSTTFNPGQTNTVDIFHQYYHFARFIGS